MTRETKLEKAAREARQRHTAACEERDEECDALLEIERKRIGDLVHDKHAAKIVELGKAAHEAEQLMLTEREINGAKEAKYPVGTKLVRWVKKYDRWNYRNWENVGFGVVEVCTRETVHPGGWAEYSCAEVGDVIVRHLKKDGTPGAMYSRKIEDYKETFLPEGKQPQ